MNITWYKRTVAPFGKTLEFYYTGYFHTAHKSYRINKFVTKGGKTRHYTIPNLITNGAGQIIYHKTLKNVIEACQQDAKQSALSSSPPIPLG
jgi:hypothetical protein